MYMFNLKYAKCILQTPDYILEMKYAFTYLAYFNSAINPILYAGLNDNFHKGFKNLMHYYVCRGRNAIAPSEYMNGILRCIFF